MLEAVKKTFSPEFRNRLDGIIAFNGLDLQLIKKVVKKELKEISKALEEKNISFSFTEKVVDYLSKESFSEEYGARNVKRVLEEKITSVLVDEVLFGKLVNGGNVFLSYTEKSGIKFRFS